MKIEELKTNVSHYGNLGLDRTLIRAPAPQSARDPGLASHWSGHQSYQGPNQRGEV